MIWLIQKKYTDLYRKNKSGQKHGKEAGSREYYFRENDQETNKLLFEPQTEV